MEKEGVAYNGMPFLLPDFKTRLSSLSSPLTFKEILGLHHEVSAKTEKPLKIQRRLGLCRGGEKNGHAVEEAPGPSLDFNAFFPVPYGCPETA